MPAEGLSHLENSKYLSRAQIVRFVEIMSRAGIEKIRLTGGEPLLRRDIIEITRDIKKISCIRDLSLTTNGSLLPGKLKPLKEAGLDRINISLDSLDSSGFEKTTLTKFFAQVVQATQLALEEGFPVKVNMVVLKSINDDEIMDFVLLAYEYPLEIRFLEFMPLCGTSWNPLYFMPMAQIRNRIMKNFQLIEEGNRADNVAQTYCLQGGKGKIGLIAPMTEPFCEQCSRIRLTADGKIRPCLFWKEEFSIGDLLQGNVSDEKILEAVRNAVRQKPVGNPLLYGKQTLEHLSPFFDRASSTPYIRSIGG